MKSHYPAGGILKVTNFNYSSAKILKTSTQRIQRNPIKIVVEKIGPSGGYEQQIVNQDDQIQREVADQIVKQKVNTTKITRKKASLPILSTSSPTNHFRKSSQPNRSHVFNRFMYDNYQKIPTERTNYSERRKQTRLSQHQKNIEIVFCQNKLPDFVDKTNQKIEQIYKKQQQALHTQNKKYISTHLIKEKPTLIKKTQKTNLATCLKEFEILQKLSNFMQSDQNLKQRCLCFSKQRDPSRTLLIDVLNHRFSFIKQINRRLRDSIYKNLLRREEINELTKINLNQYMRFCEIFIGRDASVADTATFIYLILFGGYQPSLQLGRAIISQTNGPLYKQKVANEMLLIILQDDTPEEVINAIAQSQSFMRIIIDLIIQK